MTLPRRSFIRQLADERRGFSFYAAALQYKVMKKKVSKVGHLSVFLRPYNNEIKRHMGALSEEFQGRVQGIGEQYFDLKRDINGVKKTLDSHTETLDSHTEMIGRVLIDLTEVKGELKQKVSYGDFAKLEKRVAHLEARH